MGLAFAGLLRGGGSDSAVPAAAESQVVEQTAGRSASPEAATRESAAGEIAPPGTAVPATTAADDSTADTAAPDTAAPDTAASDTAAPDTAASDAETANAATPEALEFFERRVRPLLASACYKCHGPGSEPESDLRVDSRSGLLRGGYRGPAIVPGSAETSLLLLAVRHVEDDLRMPPERKLSEEQIAVLARWIDEGAAWPEAAISAGAGQAAGGEPVDGSEVADYWAFRPVVEPPIPAVARSEWVRSPIDAFVLEALEAAGLEPAPPADKRTLLRRLSFDLTGLPPTRQEIADFLADTSDDAVARVVDRLLASPHYGERWGRHWLDVVRFAETNGYNLDNDKFNAYRYRDYVIEAFNTDLPYDEFVREQLAGDLLDRPRISADGTYVASAVGSGFWWLGEVQQVQFDPPVSAAEEMESQLDVFGKAFMGLTLACARCHDHKYDPIVSEDYYALAGFVLSTTTLEECVDTPEHALRIADTRRRLEENQRQRRALLNGPEVRRGLREAQLAQVRLLDRYLLAAGDSLAEAPPVAIDAALLAVAAPEPTPLPTTGNPLPETIDAVAARYDLEPERLSEWVEYLSGALARRDTLFYPWAKLQQVSDATFARRLATLLRQQEATHAQLARPAERRMLADFEGDDYGDWVAAGHAFGTGPTQRGDEDLLGLRGRGYASSFGGSDRLTGRLRSPWFEVEVERRFLCFRIVGGNHPGRTAVNLLFHSPTFPQLDVWTATGNNSHEFELRVFDLTFFMGQRVCLEIVDEETGPWGHVMVDDVFLTSQVPGAENVVANPALLAHLAGATSREELAGRYQQVWQRALSGEPGEESPTADPELADAWAQIRYWSSDPRAPLAPTLDPGVWLTEAQRAELARLDRERDGLERELPDSVMAVVSCDRTPRDAQLHIRGDAHDLGDMVPRGFLSALARGDEPPLLEGSGRRELAAWLTSPEHPLTARVLVNRVWQHHFGRGLVATPDNFGVLGDPCSHPALLDWLAAEFVRSGWSIKTLHRTMLLSSAYQQSSRPTIAGLECDPDNRLVHHVPVRRLDAEIIRDAILATAGTLDPSVGGPSIRFSLDGVIPTPGLEPRDRRRSVYVEVRRNNAVPFFEVFDFPKPVTTTGRRAASIVPAQALAMLNSPFVAQQARLWVERLAAQQGEVEYGAQGGDARGEIAAGRGSETTTESAAVERIATMYEEALGRQPTSVETAAALDFLATQSARYADLASGSNSAAGVDASDASGASESGGSDESGPLAREVAAGAVADDSSPELRAWADLGHVLLNTSEFLFVR